MADNIYESAQNFRELEQYEYRFVVSKNRKIQELKLDFRDTDFYHIIGLQYLKDIAIPRNRKATLKNILDVGNIRDEILQKSRFYNNLTTIYNVKSRIEESRFLATYLDVNNLIYIYSLSGRPYIHSQIKADFVIESKLPNSSITVYILIKRRKEDRDYYGIVSFFKKGNISYGGDALYWMLKEKKSKTNNTVITLCKNKNYNE